MLELANRSVDVSEKTRWNEKEDDNIYVKRVQFLYTLHLFNGS